MSKTITKPEHQKQERISNEQRRKIADKVLYITLGVNFSLMAFKFIAGLVGHSGAMLSDSIHTMSDLAVTAIALFGIRFASRATDSRHPYGHQRIESVVALFLACILGATALLIGKNGIGSLTGGKSAAATPELIALIAAVLSIAVQETLYHVARHTAKKIDSPAMLADAWHHRSDALSSVGSFIGIGAAMLGYWFMDPVASLIICVLIMRSAVLIAKTCIEQLIDTSAPEGTMDSIRRDILAVPGVLHIDHIRSRLHASRVYVDTEIAIPDDFSFAEAHGICEQVHRMLEEEYPEILHCTVHANPHSQDEKRLPKEN